jgi:hypothetical protein
MGAGCQEGDVARAALLGRSDPFHRDGDVRERSDPCVRERQIRGGAALRLPGRGLFDDRIVGEERGSVRQTTLVEAAVVVPDELVHSMAVRRDGLRRTRRRSVGVRIARGHEILATCGCSGTRSGGRVSGLSSENSLQEASSATPCDSWSRNRTPR